MRVCARFGQRGSEQRWRVLLVAVALGTVGCGDLAENLVEEGVEKAIEQDTGEDIELDFNGEDGIRIETDEGTMTVDEDGNFVIEGADGEIISGETSEDGMTVTDQDGEEVLTIDEDNGTITSETDDGSFSAGPGIPEAWPGSVPQPDGLSDVSGSTITGDGELLMSITGTPSGSAVDYFDSYESSLEGAGYERASYFESDGIRQGTYQGDDYTVTLVGDDNSSNVAITVITAEG